MCRLSRHHPKPRRLQAHGFLAALAVSILELCLANPNAFEGDAEIGLMRFRYGQLCSEVASMDTDHTIVAHEEFHYPSHGYIHVYHAKASPHDLHYLRPCAARSLDGPNTTLHHLHQRIPHGHLRRVDHTHVVRGHQVMDQEMLRLGNLTRI